MPIFSWQWRRPPFEPTRIRLGTGVLLPVDRIARVAASGASASLNTLALGRINSGISTGLGAARTMGLGPVWLADLERCIHVIGGLGLVTSPSGTLRAGAARSGPSTPKSAPSTSPTPFRSAWPLRDRRAGIDRGRRHTRTGCKSPEIKTAALAGLAAMRKAWAKAQSHTAAKMLAALASGRCSERGRLPRLAAGPSPGRGAPTIMLHFLGRNGEPRTGGRVGASVARAAGGAIP